jgi:hypothetical protein
MAVSKIKAYQSADLSNQTTHFSGLIPIHFFYKKRTEIVVIGLILVHQRV